MTQPSEAVHKHRWTRCKPGTVGAGAASYCACGQYAVDAMKPEGDPDYYVHSGDRARTIRFLTMQGYRTDEPPQSGPSEQGST